MNKIIWINRLKSFFIFGVGLFIFVSLLISFSTDLCAQESCCKASDCPNYSDCTCSTGWQKQCANVPQGCNAQYPGTSGWCTYYCAGVTDCGGNSSCGIAAAPACDGSCPEGNWCSEKTSGGGCTCKPFSGVCSGPYVEECRKNCQGGTITGDCPPGANGDPRVMCRHKCCTGSKPDAPVLVSPPNGYISKTQQVTLRWNPIVYWGVNCVVCDIVNTNRYFVYAGYSSGALRRVGIVDSSLTSYTYTVSGEVPPTQPIYWRVVASNGCPEAPSPSVAINYFYYRPCTATKPSGISINHNLPDQWNRPTISWTPGTGGTKQYVFISQYKDDLDKADLNDICGAGTSCLVANRTLGTTVSSYQNPAWKLLSANTNYYWRVVNWKDADCSAASGIFPALSSCTVTVQKPDPFFVDNQGTVSVNLLGDISGALEVKYKSNDSSIVSVDPETYQKPSPFSAVLWAKKAGWSSINAQTRFNGTRLDVQCTSELFEVKDTTGWWQVKDSDVTTNSGLFPRIPDASTLYFNLEGTGGFPGVSMYGGSTDLKKETVAVNKKWLANASSSVLSKYNYAFFRNLVDDWWPARQNMVIDRVTAPLYFKTGGDTGAGYHLFYHQGDLSIEVDQDLGWQKSILFVDGGNLTINAKINLGDGHGFFMAIVGKSGTGTGGNIIINPSVQGTVTEVPILPELEGFFLADGTISTGSNGKNQDNPLHIRGAMAGLTGINLQRSMSKADNQYYPSEYLEYALDLVMVYPFQLTTKKTRWKEVAP